MDEPGAPLRSASQLTLTKGSSAASPVPPLESASPSAVTRFVDYLASSINTRWSGSGAELDGICRHCRTPSERDTRNSAACPVPPQPRARQPASTRRAHRAKHPYGPRAGTAGHGTHSCSHGRATPAHLSAGRVIRRFLDHRVGCSARLRGPAWQSAGASVAVVTKRRSLSATRSRARHIA